MSAQPPYPMAPAGEPVPPPGYPAAAPARTEPRRRHAVLFILLFLLVVGLSFFAPMLFLLSGDHNPKPAHVYRFFREGGLSMWGILLSQMFVWAVIAALGALLVRGTRVPGAVLFVVALLPFGVGVLGAVAGSMKVTSVIEGDSIDPSQKARILAMGISELTNTSVYGGTASAFAMYLVAVAAVLGLVTVDPAPLGAPPRSAAWLLAMPVGLGFVIVSVAARAVLHVDFFMLDALVLLGVLTSGLLAGAGGKILPALVAAGKDEEAGRAFRQLLLAGLALGMAMLLSDRALLAASIRSPMGAISGESVDPSQRFRIVLAAVVPAERGRPVLMILDALGCLAAFAVPLAAARAVKGKVSIAGVAAGVVAVLTGALALFGSSRLDHAVAALREPYEALDKALAANAITLPQSHDDDHAGALHGKPELLVKPDGSLVDERRPAGDDTYPHRVDVAADASVPFEAFMARAGAALLGKDRVSTGIGLVLLPQQRLDFAPLGILGGLLGTDLLSFPVTVHGKIAGGLPPLAEERSYGYGARRHGSGSALAVLSDGKQGRLVAVTSPTRLVSLGRTVPLGADTASREDRKRVLTSARGGLDFSTILLSPAPGDTMGHVVEQLQGIAASLGSTSDTLAITGDRAALEAAPAASEAEPATPVPSPRAPHKRPGR